MYYIKVALFAVAIVQGQIVHHTPNGDIKGQILRDDVGNEFYAFLGIKYAEQRRFEEALPLTDQNWTETYDATTDKPKCIQVDFGIDTSGLQNQSEDCLFLNIYTPSSLNNTNNKLPVMVFIHGGGFHGGSSRSDEYRPDYFMKQNVIVVTLNYRLSIFGFLSNGGKELRGNYGIKDVVIALKWIKERISAFNGDEINITIFGQSAGSAIISYLIHSPLTRGKNLFKNAILQSGTTLCTWPKNREPKKYFDRILLLTGCVLRLNLQQQIDCLKTVSNVTLKNAGVTLLNLHLLEAGVYQEMPFAGVEETTDSINPAINQSSHFAYKNGDFEKVNIMIGVTNNEAALSEVEFNLYKSLLALKGPSALVPVDLCPQNNKINVSEFYFGSDNILPASYNDFVHYANDILFHSCFRRFIDFAKNYTNIHCYVMTYKGELGNAMQRTNVIHAEDLQYLFRTANNANRNVSSEDLAVRNFMIEEWTRFAKSGSPNWKKIEPNAGQVECFNILDTSNPLITNPFDEGYQFWQKQYALGDEKCFT